MRTFSEPSSAVLVVSGMLEALEAAIGTPELVSVFCFFRFGFPVFFPARAVPSGTVLLGSPSAS